MSRSASLSIRERVGNAFTFLIGVAALFKDNSKWLTTIPNALIGGNFRMWCNAWSAAAWQGNFLVATLRW
jgi:hypothetical protein